MAASGRPMGGEGSLRPAAPGRHAKVVLGPHGGGFASIMFAPEDAVIIEVDCAGKSIAFRELARQMGQPYIGLHGNFTWESRYLQAHAAWPPPSPIALCLTSAVSAGGPPAPPPCSRSMAPCPTTPRLPPPPRRCRNQTC